MRVLVACEFSGIVRDAFTARGHAAWSCDLLPSERPGLHLQGDVLQHLNAGWDLIIAHPPCTYLCRAGARWWSQRRAEQAAAIAFVYAIWAADCPRVAIENPIGRLATVWRKPDQVIHPWQFGHDASKTTCLWTRGLPQLTPTNIIRKARYANQTPSGQNRLSPSKDRWRLRSLTYQGIADAMADQWQHSK